MKDLKYLQYFEDLALQADNALVEQAKKGRQSMYRIHM